MKMSRRKVRETIFLLLFRVEFNTQEELQEQIKWYFEERPDIEGKDQIYIETKIGSILKRLPEIDEQIHSVCEGWRLERLGKPELAILRLAVYEITNDAARNNILCRLFDWVFINEAYFFCHTD